MRRASLSSPSELFDAAIHPEREDELEALGLEVVARPGEPAQVDSDAGLLAIRRGLGEHRLAVMSEVNRVVEGRGSLEAEGVTCEGYGDGVFAELGESRPRRRALRIASIDGLLLRDTVLLRPRPAPSFDFGPTDFLGDSRGLPSADAVPPNVVPPDTAPPDTAPLDTAPPDPAPPPSPAPLESWEGEGDAEAITDPIQPVRPPIALSGGVGRAGRNNAPDVKSVQARLVELRALESSDATSEQPSGAGAVPETALAQTIEAIERFQRQMGLPVDGLVEVASATRTELDQTIPTPTAAEFSAVATERRAIGQSVNRGLTIKGAVGATAGGNDPNDVRAVQRKLVDIGALASTHAEAPAASATAPVPQSSLRATIVALRTVQKDVDFWVSRGTISGKIAPGVVAPGDATATLLDRISVYSMTLGTHRLAFRDHVAGGNTRSDAGVMFVGTARPSAIPLADYRAAGLSAAQAAALKQVSTHEGSFDAINTYDRALVSAGFIQFAGGRGLPRYLALLKARQPARFRDLFQKFGLDVEFVVARGAIDQSRLVVLDPDGSRVLRSSAAEAAVRDDKRLTAVLIVSGRDRDVQRTQLEAAVRDYVLPILNASVSWASTIRQRAAVKDLFRSQKGMAALFDRCIQEGLGAARRRVERIIQRLVTALPPEGPKKPAPTPSPADMQRREGDILAELERDLQAAAEVADRIGRARRALTTLVGATRATGATPASILARSELADARKAVSEARVGVPGVVNATTATGVTVEAALGSMTTTLASEEGRLAMTTAPPTLDALRETLVSSRQALATALAPVATSPMFLSRIQRIRRSTLDSSLTAEAVA